MDLVWSSGDGSGHCLGLSENSRQAHMLWVVFSSVKQYVLYLMSLGTIWPGELPARIACTIAWHCLISLYLSPHISPRTTTSERWQNNHSNKTHCIVFTAFETCTGNFTRHCVEGRIPGWLRSAHLHLLGQSILASPLGLQAISWIRRNRTESSSKSWWTFPSSKAVAKFPGDAQELRAVISQRAHLQQENHTLNRVLTTAQGWRSTQHLLRYFFWML